MKKYIFLIIIMLLTSKLAYADTKYICDVYENNKLVTSWGVVIYNEHINSYIVKIKGKKYIFEKENKNKGFYYSKWNSKSTFSISRKEFKLIGKMTSPNYDFKSCSKK